MSPSDKAQADPPTTCYHASCPHGRNTLIGYIYICDIYIYIYIDISGRSEVRPEVARKEVSGDVGISDLGIAGVPF